MASRQLLIPRSQLSVPRSALYRAKPGTATGFPTPEVEVGAGGPASAPLSGVAAAAPPAGARPN
jgi:hypothetical protein